MESCEAVLPQLKQAQLDALFLEILPRRNVGYCLFVGIDVSRILFYFSHHYHLERSN